MTYFITAKRINGSDIQTKQKGVFLKKHQFIYPFFNNFHIGNNDGCPDNLVVGRQRSRDIDCAGGIEFQSRQSDEIFQAHDITRHVQHIYYMNLRTTCFYTGEIFNDQNLNLYL